MRLLTLCLTAALRTPPPGCFETLVREVLQCAKPSTDLTSTELDLRVEAIRHSIYRDTNQLKSGPQLFSGPGESTRVYSEPNGFRVYVGSLADASDASQLRDWGITAILSVVSDDPNIGDEYAKLGMDYFGIRTEDNSYYPISQHFAETSRFIERVRANNGKLLIHCKMGVNRSVAVTVAWMITHTDLTLQQAIHQISSKRLTDAMLKKGTRILSNRGFLLQLVLLSIKH